jgi:hypothetical protein
MTDEKVPVTGPVSVWSPSRTPARQGNHAELKNEGSSTYNGGKAAVALT